MPVLIDLTVPEKRKQKRKKARHKKSKGSQARSTEAWVKAYRRRIRALRKQDVTDRAMDQVSLRVGNQCNMSPALLANDWWDEAAVEQVSLDTHGFYGDHGTTNKWVDSLQRANISNPTGENGQRGVFALVAIPERTIVCPYVGILYGPGHGSMIPHNKHSMYTMRLHTACHIDAENVLYDVGYLACSRGALRRPNLCPRNHGRYVNSIDWSDPVQKDRHFDCRWEHNEEGLEEAWLVTTEQVEEGVELLCD